MTWPELVLPAALDAASADAAGADAASTDAASTGDRARLRRVLGRMDTVCFLLSAMIVTDTIGAVATGGGQAFTWLVVLAVTFFVPSALISAELGAALLVMAAGVTVTGQDNQKYFSAALTAVIALVVLAYLLVFPAFAVLRRRRPGLPRPFLVPGGRTGAAVVTIAATGWSALAAACLLWPGLGTAHPDAHLPAGFAGQRGLFELLVLAPVAVIVAAATAYCLATRHRNPPPNHSEE